MLIWIIGGVVVVCAVVGLIACLLLTVTFLGINPFGPFIYESF